MKDISSILRTGDIPTEINWFSGCVNVRLFFGLEINTVSLGGLLQTLTAVPRQPMRRSLCRILLYDTDMQQVVLEARSSKTLVLRQNYVKLLGILKNKDSFKTLG